MKTNRKKSIGTARYMRIPACLLLILMLLNVSAAAYGSQDAGSVFDPVESSENCSAVLYNNTNGLPTSEANAIAQTREGFLWIGSYSGLIRYDGNTFERVDSTTGVTSVVSLLTDSRDRLWIGTNDNGLAMMDRGELRFWHESDGLGADKVCSIAEDSGGTIYIGTTAGLNYIGQDMELHAVNDPRIAGAYIEKISLGSDGLLCCITNEDDFFALRDGQVENYTSHDESYIAGITSILPDTERPGFLFLGTENSEVYYGDPGGSYKNLECTDISPLFGVSYLGRIGDRVWVCARNGIGVIDADGFHHLSELPMNNSVGQVMEDYEGNLWFVSSRQGVMKLVPNQFSDVFARFDLPSKVVNATCLCDGRLFIATDTGLLVLDEDGPVDSIPLTEARTASGGELDADDLLTLLDGCRIRSVIRDSRDRLWISTWRACGLLRYDHGALTAFTEQDGLISDHVRVVCEASDGSILVVNTGGVNVIRGDRVTARYGRQDGISNPESLTVAAAPNGDIVLGSNGGGIYVIGKDGTRNVGAEDGLSSGIVMRVKYDPARDIFWLVTSNAIAWMSTDYQVTTIRKFPYSNNFDLYENSKGDMWVLSSDGIYVVPTEELLANGEIKPVHYGMANGLPFITTSNSYSELTSEGDLYIAGSSGVAKVNIDNSLENVSYLKQAVPYIDADGVLLYPDAAGRYVIPSGVRRLTVYPYVFNYSLTDPKVSYRLRGFDPEYVTVSRSELGPVTYTNLSGGSYRFVLEVKDALGRGNRALIVPIEKEKALHEQVWFYAVISLAAIAALVGGIRWYIRRKTQAMEKRHIEAMEKERLNSELHTAARIQESTLPHDFPPFPDRKEFDIFASMDPAREIGGDFYDFFLIDDDHLCLVIADVSGKGIPASLFMMISKVVLQNNAMQGISPAEILTQTNEGICARNKLDMFVTVWLGILEISTGKIIASNAGHEYPALMKNGRFSLLKDRHGFVIGGMDNVKYPEYEIDLSPGDKLFLYTDGVPEATDKDNGMFGTERMLSALNKEPESAPERLLQNVRSDIDGFVKGAEQFDDLTMLCIEYRGVPSEPDADDKS